MLFVWRQRPGGKDWRRTCQNREQRSLKEIINNIVRLYICSGRIGTRPYKFSCNWYCFLFWNREIRFTPPLRKQAERCDISLCYNITFAGHIFSVRFVQEKKRLIESQLRFLRANCLIAIKSNIFSFGSLIRGSLLEKKNDRCMFKTTLLPCSEIFGVALCHSDKQPSYKLSLCCSVPHA